MKDNIYLLEPALFNVEDLDFKFFYEKKRLNPNFHQEYFESRLESFLETKRKVCLLSSGTSAIHLSLLLSGVSKDDIVFCSNSTFIATVNPILYVKAKPYFVEIDLHTGNMNMNYLEEAIIETIKQNKTPRAIIITHSYGFPAEMDKLLAIKNKYNLILIEDAAEALGAKYKYQYCSTFADFGVLSFNTNKLNTTFGGGALIVKDEKTKEKVIKLSTHYKSEPFDFKHNKLAFNYRMNDLAAYIGGCQIRNINEELRDKKRIHLEYVYYLQNKILKDDRDYIESNYWLNCMKIEPYSFDEIHQEFLKLAIEIRRVWFPLNKQAYLKYFSCKGNKESIKFYETMICLPSSIKLNKESIKRIASILE